MCEFCHKHGEGKTWYLRAENYSQDLLSDLRRRAFIQEFIPMAAALEDKLDQMEEKLDQMEQMPGFVRKVLVHPPRRSRSTPLRTGGADRGHREDLRFRHHGRPNGLRLPHGALRSEQRYCYGISSHRMGEADGDSPREQIPERAGLQGLRDADQRRSHRCLPRARAGGPLPHRVDVRDTVHRGHLQLRHGRVRGDALHSAHRFPVVFRAEFVAEVNPSCQRLPGLYAPASSAPSGTVQPGRRR